MTKKNNPGQINCPHINQTDIVVEACVTLEEIWTVCDHCQEVTNKRTET